MTQGIGSKNDLNSAQVKSTTAIGDEFSKKVPEILRNLGEAGKQEILMEAELRMLSTQDLLKAQAKVGIATLRVQEALR